MSQPAVWMMVRMRPEKLRLIWLTLEAVLLDEFTRPSLLMTVVSLVRCFLFLFSSWLTAI